MNDEAAGKIVERLDVIIELLRLGLVRTQRRGPGPQELKGLDDGIQDQQSARQGD